jgi:hypothetical protein
MPRKYTFIVLNHDHIHSIVTLRDIDETVLKRTKEQMLEEYQFTSSLLLCYA